MKISALLPLVGIIALNILGCKEKETTNAAVPIPKIESYFDAAYTASSGFEDFGKTNAISDGKPARVFKDLIGDKDLVWSKEVGVLGAEIPGPLWSTPPTYTKDDVGGSVLVQNISPNLWLSKDFAAIPQPYDVYVVLREHQGVRYEGYFQVGYGLRDRGDRLEFKMNETVGGKYTASNLDPPAVLEYYKISIVRLHVEGNKSKIWINDVLIPPGNVNVGNGQLTRLGYGTPSHADQHDFYGMWVKFGSLNDVDNKVVYDMLADLYKPGSMPDKPIATKIRMDWNNAGRWTANYTYFSPTGIAEDKSKTEYRWGLHSIDKAKPSAETDINATTYFVGANATKATLTRNDYAAQLPGPHNGSKTEVFVAVKVYDINGNSWNRLLRSEFLLDNQN